MKTYSLFELQQKFYDGKMLKNNVFKHVINTKEFLIFEWFISAMKPCEDEFNFTFTIYQGAKKHRMISIEEDDDIEKIFNMVMTFLGGKRTTLVTIW